MYSLIVEKLETWLGSFILAVVFAFIGALIVFFTRDVSTLTCTRAQGAPECRLDIVNTLDRSKAREYTLRGLSEAYVEESCDDDCTYRLVVVSAAGTQPMTVAYDNDQSSKQQKADSINQFLTDPSIASLEVSEGGGIVPYLGLAMVCVGIVLVLRVGWLIIRSTFFSS
jgi:hypothetical protein